MISARLKRNRFDKASARAVGAALGLLLPVAVASAGVAPLSYTMTDLGTIPGGGIAGAINASGEIVGISLLPDNDNSRPITAVLVAHGGTSLIGTLANSSANAINDSGIIAGEDRGQGVLYIGSTKQVLPGTDSANGINSSGQVVGDAVGGAFLYSNGQIKSLGPGHAAGISDNGRIVGSNLNLHAAIFANGQSQDLGTLGGVQGQSIAVAVNNAGQIVGQSVVDQDGLFGEIYHPFLYSNGIMQDLGSPGGNGYSSAHAINNSGQIVGMYDIQPSGPFAGVAGKPFVYADGTIHDLASLVTNLPAFSTLTSAGGINDSGQIAGTVMFGDGEFHAVLLTPAEVSAVPLPSACWASLAVLPLLLFARRKIATVSP